MKKLLLVTLLFFMVSTPVEAKSCDTWDNVERLLRDQDGMEPVRRGLYGQSQTYEWWENEETGVWAVIQRNASGTMCLMASGSAFVVPVIPKGEPEGDPT